MAAGLVEEVEASSPSPTYKLTDGRGCTSNGPLTGSNMRDGIHSHQQVKSNFDPVDTLY